jgi:hypothetical protein
MASNTTERSDILLLCLGPDTETSSIDDVTVADLYEIFGIFGALNKVIIFKKKVLLKAFLQFRRVENAVRAKLELHETFLNNFGKAKLYFSALQELSFSNKYLEYKEYSFHESQEQNTENWSSVLTMSILNSNNGKSILSKNSYCETGSERGKFELADGPRPSIFNPNGNRIRNTVGGVLGELKNINNVNSAHSYKSLCVSGQSNVGISKFMLQKGSQFGSVRRDSVQSNKRDSQATDLEGSTCLIPQTPTKVLLVSNLFNCFDSVSEVYNVFSCFGNISKVLLMKNLKKALIEYTTVEFAVSAQAAMNNQLFGSAKIKVNFSRYKKIDLKKNNKSENSQQFNEVMVASKLMHRFESDEAEATQNPTDSLMIVCEKTPDLLPIDIYMHLTAIAKPQSFKQLNEEKENVEAESDAFRIVSTFASVQEALAVLSKCHNTDVKGLPLKISFATHA